jgi:hypothetical protein
VATPVLLGVNAWSGYSSSPPPAAARRRESSTPPTMTTTTTTARTSSNVLFEPELLVELSVLLADGLGAAVGAPALEPEPADGDAAAEGASGVADG